jgi:hypothetical protein
MTTTTSKRLAGPAALTTSAATKYTCPAATVAVIRRIRVDNPGGGSTHAFTLSIGADAVGTRLYDALSVPAGGVDIYGPFSLAAGEIIQAFADNTALVLEIDGTETA